MIFTKDTEWVRQAFLVKAEHMSLLDARARTASTADLKFVDTTIGGNIVINPPPQFTRNADIKTGGTRRAIGSKGMGWYYSEAIDDSKQVINMRMGVPQFNSLTTFFNSYYNSASGQLARTGRATSALYTLGQAAGFVVSTLSWKLLAVRVIGRIFKAALEKPTSKYYYMKPAMPQYWSAVQTIVNNIAVNQGLVPRIGGSPASIELNNGYQFDQEAQLRMHYSMPDIFNSGGSVDVYAIANKAQRLARRQDDRFQTAYDKSRMNIEAAMKEIYDEPLRDRGGDYHEYMTKWLKTENAKPKFIDENNSGMDGGNVESAYDNMTWTQQLSEAFSAEWDDGGAWASFRVNYTGSVGESFSNSITDSEIQNKINSMSSSARSMSFSFANGNLAPGVGEVVGAVKSFIGGVADGIGLSGLAALGGSAFVDIPKHWHSSVASLPKSSYTINLVSPYGNPISQLMNLYIPLAMLLAMALPLSTGAQSYTSPFLVELYDRGRAQTRLGMIENMAITRGTSNLGFGDQHRPMAIDVSFSVVDMSSVMHMPISMGTTTRQVLGAVSGGIAGSVAGPGGTVLGAVAGGVLGTDVFDDSTIWNDYMAILGGLSLADQVNTFRKLKLALTRQMTNWKTWTSPYKYASILGDTLPGHLMSAFHAGTIRN